MQGSPRSPLTQPHPYPPTAIHAAPGKQMLCGLPRILHAPGTFLWGSPLSPPHRGRGCLLGAPVSLSPPGSSTCPLPRPCLWVGPGPGGSGQHNEQSVMRGLGRMGQDSSGGIQRPSPATSPFPTSQWLTCLLDSRPLGRCVCRSLRFQPGSPEIPKF